MRKSSSPEPEPDSTKNYQAPLDALVRTLPTAARYSAKVWWNEWIGKPFLSKKKTSNGGAKGWMRRKFVTSWWSDNMPDINISDQDKLWYFNNTQVGTQLYSYVNNSSKRGTGGRDPDGPASKDGHHIKQRTSGHDYWRRANRDKYDQAVDEWKKKRNGKEPNFGYLRKISFDAFAMLPAEEREPWDAEAEKDLEVYRAQANVVLPTVIERSKYHYGVINKELDEVLKRGETKANIRLIGVIVHETPEGTLKIERKFSESLRAFSNNPVVTKLLHVFGDWIEENGGESVEGSEPTATVYPNYAKENYPVLPNYVGWTLGPLQDLVRGSLRGIFAFQGGIGRVMWTEIKANPEKFFQRTRVPQILLDNMEDPSRLSMLITTTWVDLLLACFTGKVEHDKIVQFALVPAGTKPIHPKDSQEDSREQIERDGKRMWMLSFTKTVDYCHQPGGPAAMLSIYTKGAIAYADYMAVGRVHHNAVCAPPTSWLNLPSANSSVSDIVIVPVEMEYWLNLAEFLPTPSKNRVTLSLDRIKQHQYHLPAVDPKGLYKSKKPLHTLMPSAPQPSAVPSTIHRLLAMCQRNPAPNATAGYLEEIFEDALDKGLLIHEPSGTLLGGDTGVVTLLRPLLYLYFGLSIARREFDPPEPLPTGYDVSRLPIQDYDRLCSCIDRLSNELDKSTKILAQTSAERRGGLGHLQSLTHDDTPTVEQPPSASDTSGPVPSGSSALPPPPKPKPRKKRTPSKSKKGKEPVRTVSDDEESEATLESERGGEEQNYDELDKTPQDDEGDDSWLNGDDSFGTTPLGTESSDPTGNSEDLDRLELARRYGFAGVNIMPEPHDSILEPHSHDGKFQSDWKAGSSYVRLDKDDVFGKFNDLPDYDPLHFHTPNALIEHIEHITKSCHDAMTGLHRYLDKNLRSSTLLQNDARVLASDYPKHQILYEYILLRRVIWYDAERVAISGIFGHEQHLALIFREAAQAQLMAHETLERGKFPDPDIGPVDLALAVRRLNKAAAEVRWTFREFRSFHGHAIKWYNQLQGSWLYGSLPTDLPALVQVVQGLTDWTDDTTTLMTKLRSKRQDFWAKHVNLPFEPRHKVSGMRYRFGCLSIKEEPEDLRDALNHAVLLVNRATPTPSIHGSEAQVGDQIASQATVAKMTSGDMDLDPPTTPPDSADAAAAFAATSASPITPVVSAAPAACTAPTAEAPVTRHSMSSPAAPTLSTSPGPSATPSSTLSSTDSTQASKPSAGKRKREDEQQPRRTSKRFSAPAVAAVPDVPRTRAAAAKAAESNGKVAGKERAGTNGKSGGSKRK